MQAKRIHVFMSLLAFLCLTTLFLTLNVKSKHRGFFFDKVIIPENSSLGTVSRDWYSAKLTINGEPSSGLSPEKGLISRQVIHWAPDWENKTNISQVLSERIERVNHFCNSDPPRDMSQFSLIDRPKHIGPAKALYYRTLRMGLSYCRTAKTGSTFIMSVLKRIDFPQREENDDIIFTTVRNPWHRLVSTYLYWFKEVGILYLLWINIVILVLHFCPRDWDDYLDNIIDKARGRRVTPPRGFCQATLNIIPSFKAFVTDCMLPSLRKGQIDVHWLPSVNRCLCKPNLHLNYIVVTENLMNELAYILEAENFVDQAKPFLIQIRNETIEPNEKNGLSKYYQDYYKDISLKDITEIRRLYEDDFRILGYPDSPFVDSRFS